MKQRKFNLLETKLLRAEEVIDYFQSDEKCNSLKDAFVEKIATEIQQEASGSWSLVCADLDAPKVKGRMQNDPRGVALKAKFQTLKDSVSAICASVKSYNAQAGELDHLASTFRNRLMAAKKVGLVIASTFRLTLWKREVLEAIDEFDYDRAALCFSESHKRQALVLCDKVDDDGGAFAATQIELLVLVMSEEGFWPIDRVQPYIELLKHVKLNNVDDNNSVENIVCLYEYLSKPVDEVVASREEIDKLSSLRSELKTSVHEIAQMFCDSDIGGHIIAKVDVYLEEVMARRTQFDDLEDIVQYIAKDKVQRALKKLWVDASAASAAVVTMLATTKTKFVGILANTDDSFKQGNATKLETVQGCLRDGVISIARSQAEATNRLLGPAMEKLVMLIDPVLKKASKKSFKKDVAALDKYEYYWKSILGTAKESLKTAVDVGISRIGTHGDCQSWALSHKRLSAVLDTLMAMPALVVNMAKNGNIDASDANALGNLAERYETSQAFALCLGLMPINTTDQSLASYALSVDSCKQWLLLRTQISELMQQLQIQVFEQLGRDSSKRQSPGDVKCASPAKRQTTLLSFTK